MPARQVVAINNQQLFGEVAGVPLRTVTCRARRILSQHGEHAAVHPFVQNPLNPAAAICRQIQDDSPAVSLGRAPGDKSLGFEQADPA